MPDDIEVLIENEALSRLLTHYADAGAADRMAWQMRLMQLDGVEAKEMSTLHGLLIAFGWVDLNTGVTMTTAAGQFYSGYRITAAGVRVLRQLQSSSEAEPQLIDYPALT